MKISNFEMLATRKAMFDPYFAKVDVETGALWWKKKERKLICKTAVNWFFVDTGQFCPDFYVEMLEKAAEAKAIIEKLGMAND